MSKCPAVMPLWFLLYSAVDSKSLPDNASIHNSEPGLPTAPLPLTSLERIQEYEVLSPKQSVISTPKPTTEHKVSTPALC